MDVWLFQHRLLKRLFFSPSNGLGTLVEDQLAIDVWVYFWAFNIPLVCMSILMPVTLAKKNE